MFTTQEDQILLNLVQKIGSKNWEKISKLMPGRSPKQCRDRYCNYLSEPHKPGPWMPEEDDLLLHFLSLIGPKWVEISRYIPGRSGSNVKNRWYKHLIKNYSYQNGKIYILNIANTANFVNEEENKALVPKNVNDDQNDLAKLQKQYSIQSLLW